MNNDDFIRIEEERDARDFKKCMSSIACFFIIIFLIVIIWKYLEQ
jgi:hypothetical protein